ncbi:MAG: molybdenum cofactor guanylyltransferase MobA [Pseudomonadota bacterium]
MSVAGVVLAGGLARRMGGGDKTLLHLGDRPLLGHVLARLRPQVAGLAINANGDPDRFSSYGHPVIPDTLTGFLGPLAGVLAGLRWAAGERHSAIVTAAGDTPFFPTDLVRRLSDAVTPEHQIAMAATDEPDRGLSEHPTFAFWPVALADDLEDALTRGGLRKIIVWASRHGLARVEFPGSLHFFNVNTPLDLAEAERLAQQFAEDGA